MRWLLIKMARLYLQRHGYVVEPSRFSTLIVSGCALALYDPDDRSQWTISFPTEPYVVALCNSVVTSRETEYTVQRTT